MTSPRHVGIVAVSAEGAALCYRTICTEGAALFGPFGHPQVTMHRYSLGEDMRHIDADRWDAGGPTAAVVGESGPRQALISWCARTTRDGGYRHDP